MVAVAALLGVADCAGHAACKARAQGDRRSPQGPAGRGPLGVHPCSQRGAALYAAWEGLAPGMGAAAAASRLAVAAAVKVAGQAAAAANLEGARACEGVRVACLVGPTSEGVGAREAGTVGVVDHATAAASGEVLEELPLLLDAYGLAAEAHVARCFWLPQGACWRLPGLLLLLLAALLLMLLLHQQEICCLQLQHQQPLQHRQLLLSQTPLHPHLCLYLLLLQPHQGH